MNCDLNGRWVNYFKANDTYFSKNIIKEGQVNNFVNLLVIC